MGEASGGMVARAMKICTHKRAIRKNNPPLPKEKHQTCEKSASNEPCKTHALHFKVDVICLIAIEELVCRSIKT